jgi:hypothetical protein
MFDSITGHIGRNLWLWTAISLAVTALGILGLVTLGKGSYMAEIVTLAAMFAGTTIILISQEGMVYPVSDEEEEA